MPIPNANLAIVAFVLLIFSLSGTVTTMLFFKNKFKIKFKYFDYFIIFIAFIFFEIAFVLIFSYVVNLPKTF